MRDQRNGSFVATVGAGWVRSKGRVPFRFYIETEEFRPTHDGTNNQQATVLAFAIDSKCSYDALRTVEFVPRTDCPAHSQPDSSGYSCECNRATNASTRRVL